MSAVSPNSTHQISDKTELWKMRSLKENIFSFLHQESNLLFVMHVWKHGSV